MKIAFRYLLSRMPLQAFHTPVLMHISFCAAVNMQEIKKYVNAQWYMKSDLCIQAVLTSRAAKL